MHKWVVTFLVAIPVVLLALGGMSALHPVADSLAVFRLPLGLLTVLCGAVLWPLWPRQAATMVLMLGAAAAGTILMSMMPEKPVLKPLFTHYQKNLNFRAANGEQVAQDISVRQPDFITLQEVSDKNKIVLAKLAQTHPSQHFCKHDGVAVVSRYSIVAGSGACKAKHGLAAMQVVTPQGPVWLVSLHLRWPYPYGQAEYLQRLLPDLAELKGAIFLGGDFNMVPWSNTMTLIEQATHTIRVGHTNGTFRLKGIYDMPIDHVLAPVGMAGTVQSLDLLGSDHLGVEARIFALPEE